MRCRKVRSYLSAYCSDELEGRYRLAISEHLSTCSTCRKEAAIYNSLMKSRSEIGDLKVSDDFNAKLLNRIAQERFAETRTRAYLPRTAPKIVWGKAVPALATACLVLFVSVVVFSPGLREDAGLSTSSTGGLDDSYLTVQPTNNPNLTVNMDQGWSLSDHLARAERVSQISSSMTQLNGMDWQRYSSGLRQVSVDAGSRIPYVPNYFKIRPVVRVYGDPAATSVKEVTGVY